MRFITTIALVLCVMGVKAQQDSIRAGGFISGMIGGYATLSTQDSSRVTPFVWGCAVMHSNGVCPGYPNAETPEPDQADNPKIDGIQVYRAQETFTIYFVRVKINGVWSEWQKVESNYTKQ